MTETLISLSRWGSEQLSHRISDLPMVMQELSELGTALRFPPVDNGLARPFLRIGVSDHTRHTTVESKAHNLVLQYGSN